MARRPTKSSNPRILIVTPEITYLPEGMGNLANSMSAKAGGLADVSSSLVAALFHMGADVHVALPHYRRMFNVDIGNFISDELRLYKMTLPDERIHLAQDRIFYYRDAVYSNYGDENPRIALTFQREVINNIIPKVQPDLIHCNDWMTGLVPASARRMGIPSLFTVHNIHTHKITLGWAEDVGIDAAEFWENLYYSAPPSSYENTRDHIPVDMLASGIFASHFINTVSPTFLREVVDGHHSFVPDPIRSEVAQKYNASCAAGILNAPDPSFNSETDHALEMNYGPSNLVEGKKINKARFQFQLGLEEDPDAPLFFWPSRLDPIQKGCQLLSAILFKLIDKYYDKGFQLAIVANGAYQQIFRDIARFHDLPHRIAVCNFNEKTSRLGYAASDFMLMPSQFEPCGLPQMISMIYGSLPVAHDTGGLHDTVEHLDYHQNKGNGFLFKVFDPQGLEWAVDQAMEFYQQDSGLKEAQLRRIMEHGRSEFNHAATARKYFDIYEDMLRRPLIQSG
jgi:ADP-glucose type glycogen/starch synthase